jgi:hypothetical protein
MMVPLIEAVCFYGPKPGKPGYRKSESELPGVGFWLFPQCFGFLTPA